LLAVLAPPLVAEENASDRWEEEIAQIEQQHRDRFPGSVDAVFVGSSSIRLWDLSKSFPGSDVLNCGFGGAQLADVCRYADRLILPYDPKVVFVYAGDNDVANGKSPEEISRDFNDLVQRVRAELPKTRIVFLSIKPSPKRWALFPRMQQANDLVRQQAEQDDRLHFLDVGQVLLGADGALQRDLFDDDGLHLNEAGYRRWTQRVQLYLESVRSMVGSAD
jgi:lysophospholipase L1-like esterase